MPGFDPPDFQPGQRLTAEQLNELKDLIFSQISGDGLIEMHSSGGRLVIRLSPEIMQGRTIERVFLIAGVTKDGENNRWSYSATRVGSKSGAGYDGTWNAHPTDTATYTLYSLIQFNDTTTGTYGNGVSQADIDAANAGGANFGLGPIPVGTPVRAFLQMRDDHVPEWWIDNLPNGLPGNCAGS